MSKIRVLNSALFVVQGKGLQAPLLLSPKRVSRLSRDSSVSSPSAVLAAVPL